MKREIKFRVWTGQKMEYNIMAGFIGAFYVQGMDEKDSASMNPYNTIYPEDTPVMQFTGLKDKNGKEIYEGDVLKYTQHPGYIMEDSIMVVKFNSSNGSFGYNILGSMFPEVIMPFSQHDEVQEDVLNHCEVIANIYETPELL